MPDSPEIHARSCRAARSTSHCWSARNSPRPPASPSFLAKLIFVVFSQVRVCGDGLFAYDLTAGCPAVQGEDLPEFALLAGWEAPTVSRLGLFHLVLRDGD